MADFVLPTQQSLFVTWPNLQQSTQNFVTQAVKAPPEVFEKMMRTDPKLQEALANSQSPAPEPWCATQPSSIAALEKPSSTCLTPAELQAHGARFQQPLHAHFKEIVQTLKSYAQQKRLPLLLAALRQQKTPITLSALMLAMPSAEERSHLVALAAPHLSANECAELTRTLYQARAIPASERRALIITLFDSAVQRGLLAPQRGSSGLFQALDEVPPWTQGNKPFLLTLLDDLSDASPEPTGEPTARADLGLLKALAEQSLLQYDYPQAMTRHIQTLLTQLQPPAAPNVRHADQLAALIVMVPVHQRQNILDALGKAGITDHVILDALSPYPQAWNSYVDFMEQQGAPDSDIAQLITNYRASIAAIPRDLRPLLDRLKALPPKISEHAAQTVSAKEALTQTTSPNTAQPLQSVAQALVVAVRAESTTIEEAITQLKSAELRITQQIQEKREAQKERERGWSLKQADPKHSRRSAVWSALHENEIAALNQTIKTLQNTIQHLQKVLTLSEALAQATTENRQERWSNLFEALNTEEWPSPPKAPSPQKP